MAQKEPVIEVVNLTPKMAAQWLETNLGNRNVRTGRVSAMVRDMKNGSWVFNGDPFRFNGAGTMIDGQHRALAVAESGKTIKVLVIRDLPIAVHSTIDTGAIRRLGDELKFRGEVNVHNLGAAVRLIYLYDSDQVMMLGHSFITNSELLETLYSDHDSINESLRMAYSPYKAAGGLLSVIAATSYLGAREHGEDAISEWLEHLRAGLDYNVGDACLAYRNYAANVRGNPRLHIRNYEWFAVTIKTLNAYLRGEAVYNLRWRRMGKQAEVFPTIYTAKELKAL